MNLFKNAQLLGSFGEFCYQKFAVSKGFNVEKVGILEYDFDVEPSHKVDVKTTQLNKEKYTGKRIRSDISYDVIRITKEEVVIYPDLISPLHKFYGSVIGNIKILHEEWLTYKSSKKSDIKKDGASSI